MWYPDKLAMTLGLALTLVGVAPQATTVYEWVDEQGRRHFSDKPPENVSTPVTTREFEKLSPEGAAADDYYSIVNQEKRMAEQQQALNDRRLEKRKLQLEQHRLAQEVAAQQQTIDQSPPYINQYPVDDYGFGVYPGYGFGAGQRRFGPPPYGLPIELGPVPGRTYGAVR